MPRVTSNFTVTHPLAVSIELGNEYDAELCMMLGCPALPDGLKHHLKHLLGLCRQRILCKVPTEAEGNLALEELQHALGEAAFRMGRVVDTTVGHLARVRRLLPGGIDEYRQKQAEIEGFMHVVERARYTSPPRDLEIASEPEMVANAKVSMAIGIAQLLHDCEITPTTTLEPPSAYIQLVEWALLHVDPKKPGATKEIAAKGLKKWRIEGGR